MAKKTSFAQKAAKATMTFGKKCPACNEIYTPTMIVTSKKKEESGSWRFNKQIINICKCNEKDYE